jgi:hypothetical protein
LAGRYYDGTMFPLTLAFVLFGIGALVFSEWAERGRRKSERLSQKSHA